MREKKRDRFAGFVLAEFGFFPFFSFTIRTVLFQYGSDFCDFQKVALKKIGNIFVCLFLLFNRVQAIELNPFLTILCIRKTELR